MTAITMTAIAQPGKLSLFDDEDNELLLLFDDEV
jgi:hypothetical protein